MSQIIRSFQVFKPTLVWLLFVVLCGVLGGFIAASVAIICVFLAIKNNDLVQIETLFVLFIITFLLADNFQGVLSFAQNLRFVVLGVALFILLKFQIFKSNLGWYILPFSIIAIVITYALSPLGLEAIARGGGHVLMALVLFKSVQLLVEHDTSRFYDLITVLLLVYFSLTLLVFFIPFIDEVYMGNRFKGLTANPNKLGLISLFSYATIDIVRRGGKTTFRPRFFTTFKILLISLIILTGSRTALFSVFTYEILLRLQKNKFLLGLALLVMFSIYNIGINALSLVELFGLSDFIRLDTIENASGRTEVWTVAIQEIKNQPWLGKGMLYDDYFINNYAERFIGENRARHWYGIWNSYLSLLLNVGIIGTLAFAFFWYKMYIFSQMKNIRFAFLIICLFSGISESWMAASMNAFMPLIFTCLALQIYTPKSNTEVI